VLICAGGTGGGVYPALAVHHALTAGKPDVTALWVGSQGGMEAELVQRAGIPFQTLPAAGLHGVGWRALPGNLVTLLRGLAAAGRILRHFRPDVLFFTGGFVAGPLALAGRRVPTLLFVPDIEPGLALRSLGRFADRITATLADSQKYFSKPVIATGYPVRPELAGWTAAAARQALGLDDGRPVLLVFGGSQGARSINQAVWPQLPDLLELAQIVHISGQLDWPAVEAARAALTSAQQGRYHAFAYLHEQMGAALAAADLVVARAGASCLGEFPLFGLPAVLVPYPHAWRYQKVNADFLAGRGAAVVLQDEMLATELARVVRDLLADPSRRADMRGRMAALAQPEAARLIADQLTQLGGAQA
jgi:UDP-N-acetylglucosamine--N-acetylmuramyl-(pentapeptide) pyrophosphoryl-undecaprenol N-acetylglucosamine transferase